jgi:tRNA(Ile)-lysidine synthase
MNDQERFNLQKEIDSKNKYLEEISHIVDTLDKSYISVNEFKKIEDKKTFLYLYFLKKCRVFTKKITHYYINECIKVIECDKANAQIKFNNELWLVKYYGNFKIVKIPQKDYRYVIEHPQIIDNEFVSCNLTGDLTFIKVTNESFPLTIRAVKKTDVIKFGDLKKRVNRVFIDYKIPKWQRNSYPIIVDKEDKAVFLPIYSSNTQKNMADKIGFMIKW